MYKSLFQTALWGFGVFSVLSTIVALSELFIGAGAITSITWWGVPAILVMYILVCLVHFSLLRRRGDHNWNVEEIRFSVKYLEDDGSKVEVKRNQTVFPNRPGVQFLQIQASASEEIAEFDVDRNNWRTKPITGKVWGQNAPTIGTDHKWFRQSRKFRLFILPKKQGQKPEHAFPYPRFGLLHPRVYPKAYCVVEIEGISTYKNSYLHDEEYFSLNLRNAKFVREVTIELVLPTSWSRNPTVNLYRIGNDRLEVADLSETRKVDDDTATYSTTVRNCRQETLRLDWRKAD